MNGTGGPDPRRWFALAVISTAQLLMVLSDSVINIALPSAARDLGMTDASRAWAITAYVLAFGGLLLLGGRVADTVGRKRALGIGLLGFAAASVVGGLATGAPVFFAARAGQGVFAALVTPAALALITVTFADPRERARAFGVYGAISGVGAALGVIAGGLLTEFVSWRWCLLVNVPIAVGAAALTIFVVRESRVPGPARYDVAGAVSVTAGLTALVWAFIRAADPGAGWRDAGTLFALVGGVLLIVVFVLIERTAASPLVPLRLVLERIRGPVLLSAALINAGLFGLFLFLAFYLQQVMNFSVLRSGLAFLPFTAAIVISSAVVSRLTHRLSSRTTLLTGTLVLTGGLILLALPSVSASYLIGVLPAEVLIGAGMGFVFVGQPTLVMHGVSHADVGTMSALLNTAQQVGGALGTAVLNTVYAAAALAIGSATGDVAPYQLTFLTAAGLIAVAFAVPAILTSSHRIPSTKEALA